MATSKKTAAAVVPSDARTIIATTAAELTTAAKAGDAAQGSLLLTGVVKLAHLVSTGKAEPSVGADYMLAIVNVRKAAKSSPLLAKPEEVALAPRYGMVKLMRAAKERAWFHTFMMNVAKVHGITPVTETVLTEFGNRLFPKAGQPEVKDCPTADTLKAWRVDILNKKKGGTRTGKAKTIKPAKQIAAAIAAMASYKDWLPALAHDHAARIVDELGTIVDIIKANPAATAEPEPQDATAALLAKLAGK